METTAYQGPSPNLDIEAHPCDGFTVGVVEYFDDPGIDLYTEMSKPPSNIRHVFRKRKACFEKEKEYRVVLRPGSASGNTSHNANDTHCFVQVDLANLITEIRLKPGSREPFRKEVSSLLDANGLSSTPLLPSDIGVIP